MVIHNTLLLCSCWLVASFLTGSNVWLGSMRNAIDLGRAFFLVALGEGVEPDDRRFDSKPIPSQWWASWGLGARRGMWSSAAGEEGGIRGRGREEKREREGKGERERSGGRGGEKRERERGGEKERSGGGGGEKRERKRGGGGERENTIM